MSDETKGRLYDRMGQVIEARQLGFAGFGTDDSDTENLLTEEQNAHVNVAWRAWAGEMLEGIRALEKMGVVCLDATPSTARIQFLNTLYLGDIFPRWASYAYHPHRFEVAGAGSGGLLDLLTKVHAGSVNPERLRFGIGDQPAIRSLISRAMPMAGHRQPQDFPPDLATELIDEFTPRGGAVLDPCHGWGGRLIGFLLSEAGRYVGTDPSPETFQGVRRMADDLLQYVPGKSVTTFNMPFEDADVEGPFDFALTSPPYYDTERYTGEGSSHNRYRDFDDWVRGFYSVLIEKTYNVLKGGGVFALQIGNTLYPLEAVAKIHAERVGFEYIETRPTKMRKAPPGARGKTEASATDDDNGEVIVILQKRIEI